jgi:hypothetical protein
LHLKTEKFPALTRDFHLTATTATTATTKTRKYWSLGEIGYIYKSIRVYRKIAVQLLHLLHLPKNTASFNTRKATKRWNAREH